MTDPKHDLESRSIQRRKALQRGESMPTFDNLERVARETAASLKGVNEAWHSPVETCLEENTRIILNALRQFEPLPQVSFKEAALWLDDNLANEEDATFERRAELIEKAFRMVSGLRAS